MTEDKMSGPISKGMWNGRPVEDYSKDELIDTLIALHGEHQRVLRSHRSVDDMRRSARDARLLRQAEDALTEMTDQCSGQCHWGTPCLCRDKLWPAIEAIHAHRISRVQTSAHD